MAGATPFGNEGVVYRGAGDDEGLNQKVARYGADPQAAAAFAADTDFDGRINVPVITVHGINDPIAFVELETTFKETMTKGASAQHLVQSFTNDHEHSYQTDAHYVAAMRALVEWVDSGIKPTPSSIAARCQTLEPNFDPGKTCRFLPDFVPAPLSSRVPAR